MKRSKNNKENRNRNKSKKKKIGVLADVSVEDDVSGTDQSSDEEELDDEEDLIPDDPNLEKFISYSNSNSPNSSGVSSADCDNDEDHQVPSASSNSNSTKKKKRVKKTRKQMNNKTKRAKIQSTTSSDADGDDNDEEKVTSKSKNKSQIIQSDNEDEEEENSSEACDNTDNDEDNDSDQVDKEVEYTPTKRKRMTRSQANKPGYLMEAPRSSDEELESSSDTTSEDEDGNDDEKKAKLEEKRLRPDLRDVIVKGPETLVKKASNKSDKPAFISVLKEKQLDLTPFEPMNELAFLHILENPDKWIFFPVTLDPSPTFYYQKRNVLYCYINDFDKKTGKGGWKWEIYKTDDTRVQFPRETLIFGQFAPRINVSNLSHIKDKMTIFHSFDLLITPEYEHLYKKPFAERYEENKELCSLQNQEDWKIRKFYSIKEIFTEIIDNDFFVYKEGDPYPKLNFLEKDTAMPFSAFFFMFTDTGSRYSYDRRFLFGNENLIKKLKMENWQWPSELKSLQDKEDHDFKDKIDKLRSEFPSIPTSDSD